MLRQYAFNLILLFILPLWVISCQKTPDFVVQTLSSAENCMEAHPDSALNLLKRIPNPESLHGKAQADYSLLMTQAMDKNYIKPESDSLISIAVGYYGSLDDQWVAKGKSFFYYGRVMKELNRPEDAMRYYLKAKSIFDGSKEYRMLGLISEEIGTLNWSQYLTDEALLNYQDALRYYTMINDVLGMSYSSRNIARYYLSCDNKIDSAYVYYQRALTIAHDNNCNSELTILQELGVLYRLKKDYKKSEYYLLKALELAKEDSLSSGIYLSLGYTYLLMGNMTVAEDYLDKSTRGVNIYTQADAYKAKGDTAAWIKSLEEGILKFPGNDYFFANLVDYYNSSNQASKAMEFADRMLANDPNNKLYLYVKAYLYHNMKEYDNAIEYYKKAIAADPEYAEAYSNVGLVYLMKAQDYADKATTDINDPKYAEAQAVVKKFYEEAKPFYEKARALKPDQQDLWLQGLYRVYYNLNMGPEFEEIDKMMK